MVVVFHSLNELENCSFLKFSRWFTELFGLAIISAFFPKDRKTLADDRRRSWKLLLSDTDKCEHVNAIKRLKEIFERNIFANRCTSKFIYSHATNSDLHLAWQPTLVRDRSNKISIFTRMPKQHVLSFSSRHNELLIAWWLRRCFNFMIMWKSVKIQAESNAELRF